MVSKKKNLSTRHLSVLTEKRKRALMYIKFTSNNLCNFIELLLLCMMKPLIV